MANAPKKKVRSKKPKRQTVAPAGNMPATFPIVAIGASAGGLEAFSNLLRSLPAEPGIALIFIPHLDPTHESAMVELLSRTTRLPVFQAEEGMRVAVNSVYVLPPNWEMTISEGVLHLVRRGTERGHHMPIDTFLRSLADDQASNAVGVILSGTANDGTLGLAAIKDGAGITFAQDGTAKYDGMPNSAVASGVVDYVLSPDRIAEELIRLQTRPSAHEPASDAFDGGGKERLMKDVFRLLKSYSKVDFVDYKVATIRRRILRRMNINHVGELRDYVKLLHRNPQEVEALYRDVLINVTSFFRNPEVFDSLHETVYPKLLVDRSSEPVRVWVPGCSTGEETYSHAISLVESLSDLRIEVPIQIFGTDLSENAIQKARAGIYKEGIGNEVSEVRLRRFFHKVPGGGYQISKSIRDMCVFARQNVFSDPPFSRMDLISCRNVLIYLSPILQRKVIPIFHYALKPKGFLVVGNTEGLLGSGAEIFDLVDRKSKIYRKKAVPSPVTFGLTIGGHEAIEGRHEKPHHPNKEDEFTKTPADVQREADRLLLTKYVPSAVVVNDDLDILQSRGRTNRYLELPTGRVSLNLLKMARSGLLYELRALIDKARKNSVPIAKDGVVIEDGNETTSVKLEVIPFRTPARDQRHFLVLFEERNSL